MKITIIETGRPPPAIRDDWPDYPAMFRQLISDADNSLEWEVIALSDGETLPDPAGLDAILITGSPAGVYDPEPWMTMLFDFIRWAAAERTPMVGVCFGHQAMAEALGGHAAKSSRSWGLGRHTYEICEPRIWMGPDAARGQTFALAVSHQDQVVTPPPGAHVIAASAFTPFAALDYDIVPAISFQGHPEFDDGFATALYDVRRGRPLGDDTVDAAIASLSQPSDNGLVADWIARFLRDQAPMARSPSNQRARSE